MLFEKKCIELIEYELNFNINNAVLNTFVHYIKISLYYIN